MIHSMTGYGRSENNDSNYDVIVEVKSLNSRYLEVLPKIHESLYKYENNIISLVRKACKRGKVYLSIHLIENTTNCKKIKYDDMVLINYPTITENRQLGIFRYTVENFDPISIYYNDSYE